MTLYEALSEPGSVRGLPGVFQGSSRVFQGFRHGSLPCSGPKWWSPTIGTKETTASNSDHRPAFRWGKISPQPIYGCGPRKTRLHLLCPDLPPKGRTLRRASLDLPPEGPTLRRTIADLPRGWSDPLAILIGPSGKQARACAASVHDRLQHKFADEAHTPPTPICDWATISPRCATTCRPRVPTSACSTRPE